MSKVAKSKGKTRGKNGKTANCVEEQDNESTYSFQNYDSRWLFFYQGWYLHEEEEPPFLTSFIASFGSTATSLFKIWTPAWSSTSISRFHRGIFFPFFIQRTFFRFWFSMSKDFSEKKKFHAWILLSEQCKQNMETTWKSSPNMNGCRENSLRQFAQIRDYDTFLIY